MLKAKTLIEDKEWLELQETLDIEGDKMNDNLINIKTDKISAIEIFEFKE